MPLQAFGMDTFILDDIREGRTRVDPKFLRDVIENLPGGGRVYAGIEDVEEIHDLAGTEVAGAIVSCSKLMEGVG